MNRKTNKKPHICAAWSVGEVRSGSVRTSDQKRKNRTLVRFLKRADTRGGLSKGLGAFRIGRPLVSDNR